MLYKLGIYFSTDFPFFTGYEGIEAYFSLNFLQNHSLKLVSLAEVPIKEATQFRLSIYGVESEEKALEIGQQLKDCLFIAGTKLNIGMKVEKILDVVKESDLFVYIPNASYKLLPSQDFGDTLVSLLDLNYNLEDNKLKLALELYGAPHFEYSSRARFLTLILIVEAIIEDQPRSKEAVDICKKFEMEFQKLCEQFEKEFNNSNIDDSEKNSISDSLDRLKIRSIRKGYKQLVEDYLPNKEYTITFEDVEKVTERVLKPAFKFIDACYAVRSSLTHEGCIGRIDKRNFDFEALTSELSRFVSDLLLQKLVGLE
jgi:hypothetical protein